MEDLAPELVAQLAIATPQIVLVIGAIIGLVALLSLGRFVVARVRGSIK